MNEWEILEPIPMKESLSLKYDLGHARSRYRYYRDRFKRLGKDQDKMILAQYHIRLIRYKLYHL